MGVRRGGGGWGGGESGQFTSHAGSLEIRALIKATNVLRDSLDAANWPYTIVPCGRINVELKTFSSLKGNLMLWNWHKHCSI